MRASRAAAALPFALFLLGCDDSSSGFGGSEFVQETHACSNAMNAVVRDNGAPEEIAKYDTADYHSHDYWYWCNGIKYGFTWGTNVDGCQTDTFTFSPICSNP